MVSVEKMSWGSLDVAGAIELLDLSVKLLVVDLTCVFRIFLLTVNQSLDDRRKDFYRIMLRVWFNLYCSSSCSSVVTSVV